MVSLGKEVGRSQNLPKTTTGGDTFDDQLELHRSLSPTETLGGGSSVAGLSSLAARAHL